jgi:hypothetical protein
MLISSFYNILGLLCDRLEEPLPGAAGHCYSTDEYY